MTKNFNSLSGRLMLLGVLPAMLAIGAIVGLSAVDSYRGLRHVEQRVMAAGTEGAAAELNTRNDRWNNVAEVMALAQANGMFGQRKASSDFVENVTQAFPLITGAFLAYEPNADGQDAAALNGPELL